MVVSCSCRCGELITLPPSQFKRNGGKAFVSLAHYGAAIKAGIVTLPGRPARRCEEKRCSKCKVKRHVSEFYLTRDRQRSMCKACDIAASKKYQLERKLARAAARDERRAALAAARAKAQRVEAKRERRRAVARAKYRAPRPAPVSEVPVSAWSVPELTWADYDEMPLGVGVMGG